MTDDDMKSNNAAKLEAAKKSLGVYWLGHPHAIPPQGLRLGDISLGADKAAGDPRAVRFALEEQDQARRESERVERWA